MEIQYQKNPVKAIRAKCLDCCGNMMSVVQDCGIPTCPIYPFRLGKNPFRTRKEMTEEQKEAVKERLAKARKPRKKKEPEE